MTRVLVLTDLGPSGDAALAEGLARTRHAGDALAVVHALPDVSRVRPLFAQDVAGDALARAELPGRARAALQERIAAGGGDPARVELVLETGAAAELALGAADRWGAELIVVGAPADGAADSERIARHAEIPVLVARRGAHPGPIVACTDFSDPALPAVRAAAAEARRTGQPLVVVHALEPVPAMALGVEGIGIVDGAAFEAERRRDAEARLAAALATLGAPGRYRAVDGRAVDALVAVARDEGASLLVTGTLGRTGLARFLLGSVAEAVVRTAPCPVLVVRLDRQAR